jgi:glutamate-5-semialdehyde dehydrogenase
MSLTEASPLDAAKAASVSSRCLATLPVAARNEALTALHDALSRTREHILKANARDLAAATKAAQDGSLSQAVLKRLDLARPGKYDDMLRGILDVRGLEDPGRETQLILTAVDISSNRASQLAESPSARSSTTALSLLE